MVNYKLGFFDEVNSITIDLSSLIKTKSLEDIDKFTMEFNNEEELKTYLIKKGLLKEDLNSNNKHLSIIYKHKVGEKQNYKKIKVAYKKDKIYLDPSKLEILSYKIKGKSNDIEFLKRLSDFYTLKNAKYNPQGANVADIRLYIRNKNYSDKYEYSNLIYNALNDLINTSSFRYEGYGKSKFNYSGFRRLALFLSDYENEIKKPKFKRGIEPYNSNDDNFAEPDFPPNSEEEKQYIKYMDSLPNEFEIEKEDFKK